mmetsp:Transcript_2753/g.6888  ORF Transcript_2753/g.6888 Transcript_2753/m.6888 type:complete len:321 (+) Transcript_2753:107-1069(+)
MYYSSSGTFIHKFSAARGRLARASPANEGGDSQNVCVAGPRARLLLRPVVSRSGRSWIVFWGSPTAPPRTAYSLTDSCYYAHYVRCHGRQHSVEKLRRLRLLQGALGALGSWAGCRGGGGRGTGQEGGRARWPLRPSHHRRRQRAVGGRRSHAGARGRTGRVAQQALRVGHQLLDARHDVLPIGVLLQVVQRGLDAGQQLFALAVVTHLEQLLHDVVAELVLHHDLKRPVLVVVANDLGNEDLAVRVRAVLQALFDHVGRKLVLAHLHDLARQLRDDDGAVRRGAALQHVLHHVVAVLVLRELACRSQHLLHHAEQPRLV